MLFETELFEAPLFEEESVTAITPIPLFVVARDSIGTPYTFTGPLKDPVSIERHGMDWSGWLAQGETISDYEVTSSNARLVVDQFDEAGSIVSWRMSGGAPRANYTVKCVISTSAGRTDKRSIFYPVRNR